MAGSLWVLHQRRGGVPQECCEGYLSTHRSGFGFVCLLRLFLFVSPALLPGRHCLLRQRPLGRLSFLCYYYLVVVCLGPLSCLDLFDFWRWFPDARAATTSGKEGRKECKGMM